MSTDRDVLEQLADYAEEPETLEEQLEEAEASARLWSIVLGGIGSDEPDRWDDAHARLGRVMGRCEALRTAVAQSSPGTTPPTQ